MLAVGLALLVTGAWWVVRGPAVQKPVVGVPEIDLDAALARDRQSARSAGAGGSQASGGVAVAAASAAAASSSASAEERCGDEDAPRVTQGEIRDGVIVADQTKSAGAGWTATQARIDAALRGSADPFDRAVADLVNVGNMRTPAGALDALVQDATTSSDARVYAIAFRACYAAGHMSPIFKTPAPPPSCNSLTARRWAALDPGNGVPWLWVVDQAGENEDPQAQRDALAHLASVTRFDDRAQEMEAAVLMHAPLDGANDVATYNLAAKAWQSLSASGLFPPLVSLCQAHAGGDAAVESQCATIATTMFEHSDSWALRFSGASLTVHVNGDEARRKAARAERAALSSQALKNASPSPSRCGFLRFEMKRMLREGQIGDVAALREAAGMPSKP